MKVEFKELEELESAEISEIFESAGSVFLKNLNNNKLKSLRYVSCKETCESSFDNSVEHSWNRFLVASAGCTLLSPGIWTFFTCEAIAAYNYDDEFAEANTEYKKCLAGCINEL